MNRKQERRLRRVCLWVVAAQQSQTDNDGTECLSQRGRHQSFDGTNQFSFLCGLASKLVLNGGKT